MRTLLFLHASYLIATSLAFVSPNRSIKRSAALQNKFSSKDASKSPCLFARTNGDSYDDTCDVLVLGSGPAGTAMASLLGVGGELDVVMADQNYESAWVPNYGVWKDEWQTVLDKYAEAGIKIEGGAAGNSIDIEWEVTDCYFGGSFDIPADNRMRLDRPYCRVDRFALKETLSKNFRVVKANHISEATGVNMYKPAGSLVHDEDGTTIQLQPKDSDTPITMRAKIVIDTTGHETKLVMKDTRGQYSPPGFQIAYGAVLEVDESSSSDMSQFGPYAKEAMTLFDYRTDHFPTEEEVDRATKVPTFNYVMPLKDNTFFAEETSLVARPGVSFQECKDRLFQRLDHHGIKVTKVTEEEFCYIPMGGALPMRDQRILGVGGAAAMVHPSTGFHICRCLMGATDAAMAIKQELKSSDVNLDRAIASAYHALWSPENIRQRNFAVYGGEFLMKQNVIGLRGFFDGFFKIPLEMWGGFLAGWPGLAYNEAHETWYKRIWYGLNFIVKIPLPVAADMTSSILSYSLFEGIDLMQSVTPFFGEPYSYEYKRNTDRIGDTTAKKEALSMIKESKVTEEIPVALEEAVTR
ncbi:unnamed protein product [Cylindrotheca closterium]|uniref:lycopene beta-cyclase n=1 Tax=Cylindrotheca closterium TaxID=2856 RepID=A0AAD2JNI6_9STRA|nr:unnamed protein product [Cylindrotheca closterium]